jgi:DNA-binding PadR family transcriptional regulator
MSIITIAASMLMPRPADFLPLTPLSLAILLALADQDRHGYAILKEIETANDARVRPGTGTLYAALQRMTDEALITYSTTLPAEGDDSRRLYYAITELGRAVAGAELERLARLVELGVEKRLVAGGRLRPARQGGSR